VNPVRSAVGTMIASATLMAALLLACTDVPADPIAGDGHDPLRDAQHSAQILQLDRARVGRDVRLRAHGVDAANPHFSWRIDQRPAASRNAVLAGTGADVSLRTDVPGTYVVELTARVRLASVTTTVSVDAIDDLDPLIPINTLDIDALGPGIVVGGQRYPAPGNGAAGLHVLALDRSTLAWLWEQTVPVDAASLNSLASNYAFPPANSLVIMSLPASAGAVPEEAMNALLAKIGGVMPRTWVLANGSCWASNQPGCQNFANGTATVTSWNPQPTTQGSFSVIGMPGLAPGKAWYDSAAQRGTANGALVGYLTPATDVSYPTSKVYSFVFPADQYVLVDSCVSGSPNACVIAVGDKTYAPDPGVVGFHVLLLDRITLAPLRHATVTSMGALSAALSLPPPRDTSGKWILNAGSFFTDRTVAVIQTVGTGQIPNSTPDTVSLRIDQLGGTPETFGEVLNKALPYALIGAATKLPWHGTGIESSPAIDPSLCTPSPCARARGVLARDRMARYTPSSGDPTGRGNLALFPIVYQDKTPWPYEGNCAIAYLARELSLTDYPDIRSAYENGVNVGQLRPKDVTYPNPVPSGCTPFPSATEYAAIQDRLTKEFTWVDSVRKYIGNLKEPYTTTQVALETIVDDVSEELAQSVQPPPKAKTALPWLSVFNAVMPLASRVSPEIGAAMGMVSAVGKLAQATVLAPQESPFGSGSAVENVYAEAGELSKKLYNQYLAQLESLGRLQAIVLTDAGKLETVGTNAIGSKAWSWSSTASTTAARLLNQTTRSAVYAALLPVTWDLYGLKPDLVTQFKADDVASFGCGWIDDRGDDYNKIISYPFRGAVASNQFRSRLQVLPSTETSTAEVWTFALVYPDFAENTICCNQLPKTSVTSSLFATGEDGAAAYEPAWYRETYNPPSWVGCGTSNYISVQHDAFAIGPAAAAYTDG